MHNSVLLFSPIILAVIIGIMFGWEIGFGVAFLVGAISLFSASRIAWGVVCMLVAVILAIDSLRRIYKIFLYVGDFKVRYFFREDRNIFPESHDYQFSGTISVKVPNETAISELYLELFWEGQQLRAELMDDLSGILGKGYILAPSRPLVKDITFQLRSQIKFHSSPQSAIIILKTTGWKKHQKVALIIEDYT